MTKLLNELKERRIWRVLIAYPSVTFVLLQAIEFFINNYGLDGRYLTATLVAAGPRRGDERSEESISPGAPFFNSLQS